MVIRDDGIELSAALEKPAGTDKRCPLAIIIHGVTGDKEEEHLLAVSRVMGELGLAVLRIDLYGHGKSGGTFREHTLYKWLSNLLRIIDTARSWDFVTDLYLCGHSQGGLTVMLAAAMKHETIKGLIPLSPACMIPEEARRGIFLGQVFDPDRIPEELYPWDDKACVLGGNYLRIAQTIHVEEAIDRYTGPVLIVHGEADETVPISVSEAAAARYRQAELVRIPEDTHCYDYHLDLAAEAVRGWMSRQLG